MGRDAREPETGRLRLGGRWWWAACGVFALVAVVSAGGYRLVESDSTFSATSWRDQTFHGDQHLGTRGPDALAGTSENDLLFAFGAADRVYGGDGYDLIDAGNGNDLVDAGPGDDRIRALDGDRDVIRCGLGLDTAYVDPFDVTFDCEETIESADMSSPPTPDPPTTGAASSAHPTTSLVRGTIVLEDEAWVCEGPVDVDLVKVTINPSSSPVDAISLSQNCSGRIGRIEVDTWSGDGIKVQNAGTVAHDVVIESGYVRCHAQTSGYHQDGIQVMGGSRIAFRNLRVSCGRRGVNANLFIARGGAGASTPTDIVFENGHLGPNAAHTILLADALRSGVRGTVICPGRWFDYMIQASAVAPINTQNVSPPAADPRC